MAPGVARRGFGAMLAGLPALAACARFPDLPDGPGTPIEAACRIIILEDQLEEAQRINAEYRRAAESSAPPASA